MFIPLLFSVLLTVLMRSKRTFGAVAPTVVLLFVFVLPTPLDTELRGLPLLLSLLPC